MWTAFAPTCGGAAIVNGTLVGWCIQIGKTVYLRIVAATTTTTTYGVLA